MPGVGTEIPNDDIARRGMLDTIQAAQAARQADDLQMALIVITITVLITGLILLRRPIWRAMLHAYVAGKAWSAGIAAGVKADVAAIEKDREGRPPH